MNFLVIISPTSRELVLLAWQSPAPSCCALSQYSLASTGLGKENIVEMEKILSLARLKRINNFNIYHVFKSKGFSVCSSCLFQKQLFPAPCPGYFLASWVHGWVRALDRVTGGQQRGETLNIHQLTCRASTGPAADQPCGSLEAPRIQVNGTLVCAPRPPYPQS